MKKILDVCFASENNIQSVYWELDEFQLFSDPESTRYPLPEYLYRNDKKEDLSYLLNLDIFYHYALKDIIGTLRGQVQTAERRKESFGGEFGHDIVLKGYSRPVRVDKRRDSTKVIEKVKDNLTHNIIPLIEAHKETVFYFYFVPFSILYWDQELRTGNFSSTMDGVEYAIGQLLSYENVTVYFFHNEKDIILNLDNYKDYSHYGKWINSYLTYEMASGKNRLTKDNYINQLDEFKLFVNSYDYEALFM